MHVDLGTEKKVTIWSKCLYIQATNEGVALKKIYDPQKSTFSQLKTI